MSIRIEDLELGQRVWYVDIEEIDPVVSGEVVRLWKTHEYKARDKSDFIVSTEAELLLGDWMSMAINEGDEFRLFNSSHEALAEATRLIGEMKLMLERKEKRLAGLHYD